MASTMKSSPSLYQWLPLTFLAFILTTVSAIPFNTRRLQERQFRSRDTVSKPFAVGYKTFYYTQTLDHFNYKKESYQTFQQRFVTLDRYWKKTDGARSAPILAFLGDESSLDSRGGFLQDYAIKFEALLVFIEHRYCGKSIPVGASQETLEDPENLGYLNSAQALADYAEILVHIKRKNNALQSPIIVIGAGSYGGMLAAWFRLKYPHIALGALASSAPILYYGDMKLQIKITSAISEIFKEVSQSCYETIKRSWSKIDKAAAKNDGLTKLSKKFNTCKPLRHSSELKKYLESMYMNAARFGPTRVQKMCEEIDKPASDDGYLSKIFAAVVASSDDAKCYVNPPESDLEMWQRCSELVMFKGQETSETMFEAAPPNQIKLMNEECQSLYGVTPRTSWIATYYGDHNMKLVLKRFGSNIIFYNGLKDPYSKGGVLEDISSTIHTVKMEEGVSMEDIFPTKSTKFNLLVAVKKEELKIIGEWITAYNTDRESSEI